jgi:Domain of unknown function (DUF4124)
MDRLRILVAAALLALAPAAPAGVLYKSVGPNGTVMFSDMPPPADARILEQRIIPSTDSGASAGETANGFDLAAQLIDADAAVARASAQVDLAEHALALARRNTWSPRDGLRVAPTRLTRADDERIEFYKKNVLAARQNLMETLRSRMLASR